MSTTPNNDSRKQRINQLSHQVIGLCIEVHRELGPGLLESAYEEALAYELTHAGLCFERQRDMPLTYKGASLECGYRLDFIVEDELILELKSVSAFQAIHHAQLLTYLKLERRSLGLLLNFNVPVMKDGVKRVASGTLFQDEKPSGSGWLPALMVSCLSGALAWLSTRA
jgi:GxxExxY protein